MKRFERSILNSLKKGVTNDTINVAVSIEYTHDARQAMHQLLTIEKGMYASRICWNWDSYAVLYVPAGYKEADEKRQQQENSDIDSVMKNLAVSDYTWNGYRKQ